MGISIVDVAPDAGDIRKAMDGNTERLTRIALLCGQCSCGCPELLADHEALIEKARNGRLGEALAGLAGRRC